jgi:hypothetical protein
MKRNKLYIFIAIIIIILIFCFSLACITDNQLDSLFKKYPAISTIATAVMIIHIVGTEKNAYKESGKVVLNFLEKPYDPYSDKFIVVGTNNNFETVEASIIEASDSGGAVRFSEIQDEIKIITSHVEESYASETTAPEAQATKKGSITLTGNVDSGFGLLPLDLTIDLDTGVVSGSFTGSYYWEGLDAGEFGKWEPDTANGVADFKGVADIKTGKITGTGVIAITWASGGEEEEWPFTVEGDLNKDYKYASGNFVFDEGKWPWEASDY